MMAMTKQVMGNAAIEDFSEQLLPSCLPNIAEIVHKV